MSVSTSQLSCTELKAGFALEINAHIDTLLGDPAAMAEIKSLWQQWPVLIFRRQSLEENEQVRFSQYFGRCEGAGRKDILSPYHDEIIYFSTLRYADGRFVVNGN